MMRILNSPMLENITSMMEDDVYFKLPYVGEYNKYDGG